MLYDDTIAAIATPPGEGGIGIVRISGPDALPILERVFIPARRGAWRPFRMRFGRLTDNNGATVDEALAVYMRAPHSFTAEDVAEISCHGGPLVLSRVLATALACGARQAEPGEFTMRAFLNGRLDLTQAEATLDVIKAKTGAALALAQAQLAGWLAGELRRVRELLLRPLAYVTALIDFPEDEVEAQDIAAPLDAGLRALEQLLATADQGLVYRQGARVALVGRPNTGKSSLLNALLRADRAIVTPIPGTTRDTLEELANLCGIPVVLVDTAGIAETADPVERLGVARSRAALAAADVAVLVLDTSAPPTDEDAAIVALSEGKPTVLVLNKIDLLAEDKQARRQADKERESVFLASMSSCLLVSPSQFVAVVMTSALTGAGIDDLANAIATLLLGGAALGGERMITNPRHRDALRRAIASLRDAIAGHARGAPPDLLAVDLTVALTAIGEITGETVGEDLLAAIFSQFCIGK
jgi:tRNA modification GTPase